MALSNWWRGDKLPQRLPIANFSVESTNNLELLTRLTDLGSEEILNRLRDGHLSYVAFLNQIPIAYGWVATQQASIGELGFNIAIPPTNRYLWDFKTISEWRGRGVYPHLLQEILKSEMQSGAIRFWIINAPENFASGSGIAKAGFQMAGEQLFSSQRGVLLVSEALTQRVEEGAALLRVPIATRSKSELTA